MQIKYGSSKWYVWGGLMNINRSYFWIEFFDFVNIFMGIVRENSNRNLNCFVWIKMFGFLEIFSWYFLELYSFSIRTLCINSDRFVKIEFNVNKIVSGITFLYLKSLQSVIVNHAQSNPISSAVHRFDVTNSLRPWLLRAEQRSRVQVAQS